MDTKGQIYCFICCIIVGFCFGAIYEVFTLFRFACGCAKGRRKGLEIGLDLAFGFTFAIACIWAAFAFVFPNNRLYMPIGYGLGFAIYLKSLHIMVAFLKKVCYNKITQWGKKRKRREKTLFRGDYIS